jgi:GMP synthase-like glutamine amidotransferase
MAGPKVAFVLTEHPPAITPARERHYERVRLVIERIAGVPVRSQRYVEVDDFDGAAAILLSGSFAPWAMHDRAALGRLGEAIVGFDGPVLGICAGMQLQVLFAGGAIAARERPEVGFGPIEILDGSDLLHGLDSPVLAYKHHSENVAMLPEGFTVLARSQSCQVEAFAALQRRWWGTQFHPEVYTAQHPAGGRVLANFFAMAELRRYARLPG